MATSSQKEKEIFFTRLDQLDKLALEIDEDVGNDHTLEWKRSSPNIPLPNSRPDQQIASNSPVRPSSSLASIRRQPSSPLSTRKMPPRASSHKPGSEKLLWKPAKKQGGKKSLQLQPEDAQIFRGLTFCKLSMSVF